MQRARDTRAPAFGAWALALSCALGLAACQRPGQGGALPGNAGLGPRSGGEIDATSPAGPAWPGFEAEQPEPQLTDADVEQVAVKVPHRKVPAVSTQNPAKGPANAKVTLQVFSDFACPFCVRSAPTLADVLERYSGRVRMVWRNFPLPMHERARPAARAALAAFTQKGNDAFWAFHDWLFSPQADLSDAGLTAAARRLALDAARFDSALHSSALDPTINADVAAGDAAGVTGTPAVFINDYYLMGARSHSEYAVVIERALREAR
ncbi:MAG TPA: thioredoxin domain-containing protein [Polyangiaceae bacterium]|nr:thioredoxin domain-containing protein [Polyangiaceae bacterium]